MTSNATSVARGSTRQRSAEVSSIAISRLRTLILSNVLAEIEIEEVRTRIPAKWEKQRANILPARGRTASVTCEARKGMWRNIAGIGKVALSGEALTPWELAGAASAAGAAADAAHAGGAADRPHILRRSS